MGSHSCRRRRLASLEQVVLIGIAQQSSGNEADTARELLFSAHEPLMWSEIKAAGTPAILYEDALQAAREGCLEALHRFDSSRGFTFGAFARKYVKGQVLRAVYQKVRRSSGQGGASSVGSARIVSLEARPENIPRSDHDALSYSDNGFAQVENNVTLAKVSGFVEGLSARQRYVVRRVFYEGYSQADVARELGVSAAAVSQILSRVYAKGRLELAEIEEVLAA